MLVSSSQHISVLTTCIFMLRQVCTIESSFFKMTSGMHRRAFDGRNLVNSTNAIIGNSIVCSLSMRCWSPRQRLFAVTSRQPPSASNETSCNWPICSENWVAIYSLLCNYMYTLRTTVSQDMQTRFSVQLAFAKFLSKIKGNFWGSAVSMILALY